ncbi:MAG: hypothetical protein ACPHER_09100, partial [Nevskiales bacterium]
LQQSFFDFFAAELARQGYSAEQSASFMWGPATAVPEQLIGPARDKDLSRLAVNQQQIEAAVQRAAQSGTPQINRDFFRRQKTVLVLLPGYTHETLRNLSWHDSLQDKQSPHHILMLRPGAPGEPSHESILHNGDGLKVVYTYYPRSNAASSVIGPGLFELLHNSPSLQSWVAAGYRLFFVGYSNGAALSLELLADLNSGQYADDFILKNTAGFLSLCGDIGGAYLADDLLSDKPKLVNFPKLLAFARKHPLFAKLVGLGSQQLQDDAIEGIRSLGRPVRQACMADYGPRLPNHIKYYSVAAVMPLADYRRRFWQFNLDDWSMYRQALVTDPITVYNDGQVALPDNLLPTQLPATQRMHLGQVRTHHWGVAYQTFNLGSNRFPRAAFYRALMRTILAADESFTANQNNDIGAKP